MECDAHCPYCGEPVTLWIDTDSSSQRYVEDCAVCCRPCEVRIAIDDDGFASAELSRLDD